MISLTASAICTARSGRVVVSAIDLECLSGRGGHIYCYVRVYWLTFAHKTNLA
jgi:hypothetical protein